MDKSVGQYTFRLFNRPTFIGGFTAIVDFKELMKKYHTDENEKIADQNSIASDWKAVGLDMKTAIKVYGAGE